jgi:hypothetical protein
MFVQNPCYVLKKEHSKTKLQLGFSHSLIIAIFMMKTVTQSILNDTQIKRLPCGDGTKPDRENLRDD